MVGPRSQQRYPVNLRLRLQFEAGELETVTDEVSLAGFSAPCANLPEVGVGFGFVLHLPDGATVSGRACAMRLMHSGLAGFSSEIEPAHKATWEAFIAQEHASGGLWRMLSRYALHGGEQKEAARSVLERGPLGVLFRRIGEAPPDTATAHEAHAVMRLHMVGENGEAYRIAFAKQRSDPPESSPFAQVNPKLLELTKRAASRILSEDVLLKRSPDDVVTAVRVVELARGGFAYVMQHPTAKPILMGLQGSELIAVEVAGKSVFPFFEPGDLDRMANDTFRRAEEGVASAVRAVELGADRFSAAYAHKHVESANPAGATPREIRDAMNASQRVQTRVYGPRALKLYPDLWLEVHRPGAWDGPIRGFAMADGAATCVFALNGPNSPCVVRLEATDLVAILRSH